MNDHDLLITINVKLDTLNTSFTNHLHDHKKYMIMAWSTCIGLVTTLTILILKMILGL